ncbi:gliding motility protein GldM [soil metagenome]
MAGGKLTPRQKMINMMYLVLTALLALNVSKEIINAFVTVNESLEVSKANIINKNNTTYASFQQAMQNDTKKYGDVNAKALEVKKASDGMAKYIEDLKEEMVRHSDGIKPEQKTPSLRDMEKKDDYDTPTHLMCGDANDGVGAKATEFKNKIEEYKKSLMKNVPTEMQADFKKRLDGLLNTSDPDAGSTEYKEDGKRTWEMSKFYHNPVVATVALLTKFQGDIRNSESQIIDYLIASVDAKIIKFDLLKPAIIPTSTVVTIGSNYEAEVFLSATSSTVAPEVFIGATADSSGGTCKGCEGTPLPTEGGFAKFTAHPGSEGEQKWGGVIRVKNPDGTYKHYNFNTTYTAQKPNSVVSADKMNVLFIGLDNPVSISVPGVPNNKVKPSFEGAGCSLTPDSKLGGGHYIANVSSATGGKATIRVSAEVGGKQMPMGAFEYRVKSVPNPVATMGGKAEGGPINKNLLMASSMIPVMKDFYFELFWVITEFKMSIAGKGIEYAEFPVKGNQLDDNCRAVLARAKPGTKVYFEYIRGRMKDTKDQSTRQLSPMTFVLQ